MVLKILYAVGTAILPSGYYTHLAVAVVGIVTVYAFAQGRKTSRERDLHGRTILITAAFHFASLSHYLADTTHSSGCIHSEWFNPIKLPSPAWRIHHSPHL